MQSQNDASPTLSKAYKNTAKAIKNHPRILIPFLIFACIESLALFFLFLAPRMPFKALLGPPIRTFRGEAFLHYPYNFLLLPELASFSKMFLSVLLSSLLTAMAIFMALDIANKKSLNLAGSLKAAFKKYFSFLTVFFIVTVLFYTLIKVIDGGLLRLLVYLASGHRKLLFLTSRAWVNTLVIIINFIIAVFIQALFIYALPIMVIEKAKVLKSIIRSFVFFRKFFFSTLLLVGIPMLIYIPIVILNQNANFLMDNLFPEIVLIVLFIGIFLSSLVIDSMITISTTYLYLLYKKNI